MTSFVRSRRATVSLLEWDGINDWNDQGKPVLAGGDIVGGFARADVTYALDRHGRFVIVPYGAPAHGYRFNGTTFERAAPALYRASANLVQHSENLAGWTDMTTPTISSAAKRVGDISLDLMSGNTNDGKTIAATFTGDGVKAFQFIVAQGTTATCIVRLLVVDTTASASRLSCIAQFTAAGDPTSLTVTTSVGTNCLDHFPLKASRCTDHLGRPAWKLELQTTAVTAANSHVLRLQLLSNSSNVYVGAFQGEDGSQPTAYIKRVTSAATRVADQLTLPALWLPLDSTLLVEGDELGTFANTGALLAQLGDDDSGTSQTAYFSSIATTDLRLTYHNGTTSKTADQTTDALRREDQFTARGSLLATGIMASRSVNGAQESQGAAAAAMDHPTSHAETTLCLTPGGTFTGGHRIRRVRHGAGNRTLSELQTGWWS